MFHSFQLKIKIVILMTKLGSRALAWQHLQPENIASVSSVRTIKRIYDNFLHTGSVKDRDRSGRPASAATEKTTEIAEVLANTPTNTVRLAVQQVHLLKSVVHRTMRNVVKYKPYKMHLTQQLYYKHQDLCVEMSELLIPTLEDKENDGLIFFSYEVNFHVSSIINKHNCCIWTDKNPFVTVEVATNSPKVTVWCTMSSKQIAGPLFFDDDTVTQDNYLDMLLNYFHPILQKKRLNKFIIFHQNGAPAHFAKSVRVWLNEIFNDRWIVRGGPLSWASRSPDLTPFDFFLWEHLKTNVYKTAVKDLADLKTRVTKEIEIIKKETLRDVFFRSCKTLTFLY